jgi:hypothetical protein
MSSANKAKGSRFETDVENYLNEIGVKSRRLARAGAKDIGDVAINLNGEFDVVIEAKNVKDIAAKMADYLRQADTEANNYEGKYNTPAVGVVVTKTRQKSIGDARVTLTLDNFISLLKWAGLT